MSVGVPNTYPALQAVSTTDAYPALGAAGAILLCPGCARVNINVSNAAVTYQLGRGAPDAIIWGPERRLLPSFNSLERAFDAIRLRSATAGVPAVVDVDPLTQGDIGS